MWLPVSHAHLDSVVLDWPCQTDDDCSLNGVCSNAGVCACTVGWTGHRCETLDVLPVDPGRLGFSPLHGSEVCVYVLGLGFRV